MEDFSTCPLCGGTMDKGHLSAGGYRIIWTEKGRRFSAVPTRSDVLVEKTRITGRLGNTAWCCRKCDIILVGNYGR